ncbi:hypothetical protein [Methanobrevibacter ruminantium]|nr:hypothetical protein [Methanobrevibacter ruminantium]
MAKFNIKNEKIKKNKIKKEDEEIINKNKCLQLRKKLGGLVI